MRTKIIMLHDILMVIIAWLSAWLLRFNLEFPFYNWELSLYVLPLVVVIQQITYFRFKLHKGLWHFASLPDLWNIFRACIIGSLAITVVLAMWSRLEGIPRSIFILYPLLLMFFLGGPRLAYRMLKDRSLPNLNARKYEKNALLIGAGRAADMLVRDILREGTYRPVGFVDDNLKLKNSEIQEICVIGTIDDVPHICSKMNIDLIIIAIPSATNHQMQRIINLCEKTHCLIRTLPSLKDMLIRNAATNELREVLIEDLLGREKIELDWDELQKTFANKTVMVTGGGGSIGCELCYQIAKLGTKKLIIFERNEFNLYRIEKRMFDSTVSVEFILGDLYDAKKLEHIMEKFSPDIIFHAAAYKHVPILEKNAREAIRNNIVGTKNIVDLADKYKCEKFILISTDKAVNPTNVLGASKRIAELYVEDINNKSNTSFLTVRFGNVLDSDGSVVPLFREQILNGGPVTVTHPEITRYFMTIREACQLILQAGKMANGGEIFVLDMGIPVKITYLAEQMIRLSGLVPNKDISIKFIGLRSGEKMHEELFHESEVTEKTSHEKILLAKHTILNHSEFEAKVRTILDACNNFDDSKIRALLKDFVPFFDGVQDNIVSIDVKKNEKSN